MQYFAMILMGMVIGYFLYQTINAISMLIAGPILGYQFGSFSFFGMEVAKVNEKLQFRFTNFNWIPNTSLHVKANQFGKKIVKEVIPLVVGVVCMIIGYIFLKDRPGEFENGLVLLTLFVMGILYVWHLFLLVVMISQMYGSGLDAEMYRDCQEVIAKLEDGLHPKDITFRCQEPNQDYFSKIAHRQYNLLNYYKELECGNMDVVDLYISKMIAMLPDTWSVDQTPYYYEILYYYSALSKDVVKAETYASVIRDVVERDKDINGRRVYAAYLFHTGKDRKLAMQIAKEGLTVVDKFPLKGQAYMERDLINQLIKEMEEQEYGRIIEG